MSEPAGGRRYTLVTGATGFVGHVLTAELLQRGHRCALLVRRSAGTTGATLARLLGEVGLDMARLVEQGRLVLLGGSLPDDLPEGVPIDIARIVHAAASTRFEPDDAGEPSRTNDLGTAGLLAWAERRGVTEFHLISTAFAGGVTDAPVPERELPMPQTFRNAYERSKWMAEGHAIRWARHAGRSGTIYRPSIVVGDYLTGRASRFNGLYLALRAFERCARPARKPGATPGTGHLPMRIEGRAGGRINLIPVDHAARLIVDVIERPAHHGVIYNLVDPSPLTTRALLEAIERSHGVAGCRLVDPTTNPVAGLNEVERRFSASIRHLRAYIIDPPEFERSNTDALEAGVARAWPRWDEAALRRLLESARREARRCVGARPVARAPRDLVAQYFERFLPERIGRSGLAGMDALTTTFRFIVHDVRDGEWVCRFERGRLTSVRRGVNGVHEDFAYRMGTQAFWDIVGALVDPQEVFLGGRADVSGDIEQALKMGMILQQFNQEHPYRPGRAGTTQEDAGDA